MDGKTIAITRSKEDASEFIDLAQKNNATPIPLPTIELVSKGEKIVDEVVSNSNKQVAKQVEKQVEAQAEKIAGRSQQEVTPSVCLIACLES